MSAIQRTPPRHCHRHWVGQHGLTLVETIVAIGLISIVAGATTSLIGAAVRSKLITAVRSENSNTARHTLVWIAERMRNAGLNLNPSEQSALRCKDMVVAQDVTLQPTASSVHVSGEILNSDTISGNEVSTVGYRLGTDPTTGRQVVMEYLSPCAGGAVTTTPLSASRLSVTSLSFAYFSSNGTQITALTNATQIRLIRIIRVLLTVEGSEGRSGTQSLTLGRDILLRNPEPSVNDGWKNPDEMP